jgi:hypothetical protein
VPKRITLHRIKCIQTESVLSADKVYLKIIQGEINNPIQVSTFPKAQANVDVVDESDKYFELNNGEEKDLSSVDDPLLVFNDGPSAICVMAFDYDQEYKTFNSIAGAVLGAVAGTIIATGVVVLTDGVGAGIAVEVSLSLGEAVSAAIVESDDDDLIFSMIVPKTHIRGTFTNRQTYGSSATSSKSIYELTWSVEGSYVKEDYISSNLLLLS